MKSLHLEFGKTIVKYVELEVNEEPIVGCTTTPNSPDGVSDEIAENEQLSEESLPGSYETVPWRSTRHKQIPDRYGQSAVVASTEENDPSSAEAKSAPDNLRWEEAEMELLWSNDIWELVQPPEDCRQQVDL